MHNNLHRARPADSDDDGAATSPSPPPAAILMEAIARGLCVSVVYNRQKMLLAPHIIYTRHADLFVDAVAVERNGAAPQEIKLGVFKLAGLSQITLAARRFAPYPVFEPGLDRYVGETVFAVQP